MAITQNPKNPLRKQIPTKAPAKVTKTASVNNGARSEPKPLPQKLLQKFANRGDEQIFDNEGQINPQRFAGYQDQGQGQRKLITNPNERVYNAAGEINAWNKRDAFAQSSYMAKHINSQSPLTRMARSASRDEINQRREILAAAIETGGDEGFRLVAQELALPIKMIMDYEGWARKIFRVRHLQQAELFRLPKDVRAAAFCIGQDGKGIETKMKGDYITPDEGLIGSWPTVSLMQLYQLNFDVLDRAAETAKQSIMVEEDKRALRLLDRVGRITNTVSSFATTSLSVFENLRYQVERHRLIVDKFLINRQELSDIEINMSGNMDPVTQREWNLAGYVGRLLGAYILTAAGQGNENVVPAGSIYAVTAPDYLGEIGIRIELFSEPFNDLAMRGTSKGIAFIESFGLGMTSARPVAIAEKAA